MLNSTTMRRVSGFAGALILTVAIALFFQAVRDLFDSDIPPNEENMGAETRLFIFHLVFFLIGIGLGSFLIWRYLRPAPNTALIRRIDLRR